MNVKGFLAAALGSAIELGIGTADDVLRHVTPDVLAAHLPRPLWARLLTACLGAPKVDAQLVVETVGIANLCEHVPAATMWSCLADIAVRALGKPGEQPAAVPTPIAESKSAPAAKGSTRVPLAPAPPPAEAPRRPTPPPPSPAAQGPAIPAPVEQHAADDSRPPPGQRFRQAATGIGRGLGANQVRRPQAQAAPAPAAAAAAAAATTAPRTPGRRGQTEAETETETSVETGDWRGKEIAVDDSQLVDWSSDNTESRDEDFGDFSRKR
ncbi:MAG TPA: hypothetical protein VMJ10_15525 [Kofleriaceae bacterium]|nr:hypothetical protein [Kofleriaceae bacterium]